MKVFGVFCLTIVCSVVSAQNFPAPPAPAPAAASVSAEFERNAETILQSSTSVNDKSLNDKSFWKWNGIASAVGLADMALTRSEERRVGKECRSREAP